jgi:hypothetical protein
VTLTSLDIAAGLLVAAAFIAAITAGRRIARRRYQGRTPEPYGGFLTGAQAGPGERRWLACEGHCPGTTTHETAGDGEATCALCGTTRLVPAPDTV